MTNLESHLETVLKKKIQTLKGRTVWVACSGGPDSVSLFLALYAVQKKIGCKVGLIHFNHRLRPKESVRDERFVRDLARVHGVPFYVGRAPRKNASCRGLSPEEAARIARYRFFEDAAKNKEIRLVLTGHTLNDQAETVFMRIVQGTGLQGLCGIREEFKKGKLTLFRPFLQVSRKTILDYLKQNEQPFCVDATNDSKQFLRNKIRHDILPKLERQINPRVIHSLARIPTILKDENDVLLEVEKGAWTKVFKRKRPGKLWLSRRIFSRYLPAVQFRLLQIALKMLNPSSGIFFETWLAVRENMKRKTFCHSFPKNLDLALTPSEIIIYKRSYRGGDRK